MAAWKLHFQENLSPVSPGINILYNVLIPAHIHKEALPVLLKAQWLPSLWGLSVPGGSPWGFSCFHPPSVLAPVTGHLHKPFLLTVLPLFHVEV